jgi:hypothetical protein
LIVFKLMAVVLLFSSPLFFSKYASAEVTNCSFLSYKDPNLGIKLYHTDWKTPPITLSANQAGINSKVSLNQIASYANQSNTDRTTSKDPFLTYEN